jgi:hypothetical protein
MVIKRIKLLTRFPSTPRWWLCFKRNLYYEQKSYLSYDFLGISSAGLKAATGLFYTLTAIRHAPWRLSRWRNKRESEPDRLLLGLQLALAHNDDFTNLWSWSLRYIHQILLRWSRWWRTCITIKNAYDISVGDLEGRRRLGHSVIVWGGDCNKKFWKELIAYFSLVRYGPHRKRRVQKFRYHCMCIRCRGMVIL